tara:strand:+ start:3620 stop:4861 length:1242 start_codon:yes stop_codon:yes gene_type:complete
VRIALVTQYFWPETFSINDMVKELVHQGHTVDVYTGKPNYPEGDVFPGYGEDDAIEEYYEDNIRVFRSPLRARRAGGAGNLFRNYLSFVWNGIRYFPGAMKGHRYDLIFVFTLSPITSVIPAIFLKWRFRLPLVIWVLDLWPQSLEATGYVRNPLVLRGVGLLVKFIYCCSDVILVQSKAFVGAVSKYVPRKKIEYFSNFSRDFLREKHQSISTVSQVILNEIKQHFSIVFTGNVGTAQAIDTLLDAAELLQDIPDFRLVVVGSGSLSEWLNKEIEERNLLNVMTVGRYPSSDMPVFLSHATGALVSLKHSDVYAQTVPAKIQTYMAAGIPIVASLNGEGARVINEAGAGLTCNAEDVVALVGCIRQLYEMTSEERDTMGRSGRLYFLENFELSGQAERLTNILNRVIQTRSL